MSNLQRSLWLRYFVVVLSVAIALFVTLQLELLVQRTPFALFYAAVLISTWYGGRNPGLLATALSALVSDLFLISPLYSLRLKTVNFLEEAVFIAVALVIVAVISAHQRSEKSMRESEGRYRLLFESNPHPMWVYDLETLRFLTVNAAAIHHYGYTKEEFLSLTIRDIRPQEDVPDLLENISRVNGNLDVAGVWRHQRKDGSQIDVEIVSHGLTFD